MKCWNKRHILYKNNGSFFPFKVIFWLALESKLKEFIAKLPLAVNACLFVEIMSISGTSISV